MNFDKLINDMQELQTKIEVYERKNKSINDAINSIEKDISKLDKKKEKVTDEIEKYIIDIKILMMKDIIKRFVF